MGKYNKIIPSIKVTGSRAWAQALSRWTRVIILCVLCMIIAVLSPSFLSLSNILNILKQTVPVLILALGQMIVILTRGIDLSMASSGALAALVTATMLENGLNVLASVMAGLAIGALFGLVNGLIVTRIGLPPFVTTFGTSLVGSGLVVFYIHGRVIWGFPESFRFIGVGDVYGVPVIVVVGLLMTLIFYILLNRTVFGAHCYSIGSNPVASKISGISVKKIITITYIIAAVMASFASILYISRLNSAKSDITKGFEMNAIAGALIGGTSFAGGIGTVEGTIVGALLIVILGNFMNLMGVSQIWHGFFTGIMMIIMILLDESFRRRLSVV